MGGRSGPGTGDKATISAGHVVTISTDLAAIHKIGVYGTMAINANITFDDGIAEPYLQVHNGIVTSNATASTLIIYVPRVGSIQPINGILPSRAMRVILPEDRLEYIIMSGNWWFLGVGAIVGEYIPFNLYTSHDTAIADRKGPGIQRTPHRWPSDE